MTTRRKVLVSAPYLQPVLERFKPMFEGKGIELVVPPVNERLSEEELMQWVSDIDGAICGDDPFTEAVLAAAPQLKVISKWGTGVDAIDKTACERRGIAVRNIPDAFTDPVADTVLAYVLCFARKIPWMNDQMKAGMWDKIPGRALRECTLGVIGVGNIGKAVVQRARAFGVALLGNDLVDMPERFRRETNIRMVSKEELLAESDCVSLNCDLNPSSFHLMGAREFSLMKETAVVINTARGPIVDEKALITALMRRDIAGAALDVFETEPLPQDSPLRRMDNVLLAPHNSNNSLETWERVNRSAIDNLLDGIKVSQK